MVCLKSWMSLDTDVCGRKGSLSLCRPERMLSAIKDRAQLLMDCRSAENKSENQTFRARLARRLDELAADEDEAAGAAGAAGVALNSRTTLMASPRSGGVAWVASRPWIVSSAHISSPRPVFPSNPPTYHFWPHVVPSAPPVQAFAAAAAEVPSSSLTVGRMDGTRTDAA